MAKYTVKFACGHGSSTKELFGKEVERVRRIEWMESNMVCADCFKKRARAADEAAEQIAYVEMTGLNNCITIRASGRVEANKEALKSLGFCWTREYGGAMSLFDTREPPLALVLTHKFTTVDALAPWLSKTETALKDLGYNLRNNVSPIDLAMLAKSHESEAEKAAANPKPSRPDWYADLMSATGKCNGRLYGKKGAWRIYISNAEHRITDAQAVEFEAYFVALAKWKKVTA